MSKRDWSKDVEVYEPFQRADGAIVWAWVTWRVGAGERQAVAVRLTDRRVSP